MSLKNEKEIIEEKIIKGSGDIQIRRFYKGNELGIGGFAKCYEFICIENNKKFAAKILKKNNIQNPKIKQKLISEIKIHKLLHHPNIVSFEHNFEDENNVYILLELCENKSFKELLVKRKTLTELEVKYYLIQLISALKYLHSLGIIHRDLKLGNLFLTDDLQLKLGDFGFAVKLESKGERRRTICGTPNYMAPEIFDEDLGHSYEVDIWALGVIIYFLLIGKFPFKVREKTKKKYILNYPAKTLISNAAKDLISQILNIDPRKRPNLDKILTHDFFFIGNSLPDKLPKTILITKPDISYIRKFIPEANDDGIVNKPIKYYNELDEEYWDKYNYDPMIKGPDTWVKKWADYSSKYGLGYVLNNGLIGIYYNDESTIILDNNTKKLFYIKNMYDKNNKDKKEIIKCYHPSLPPKDPELNKKYKLIDIFIYYLKEEINLNELNKIIEEENNIKDIPNLYITIWMRTNKAIIFKLSNKIIHICFNDDTEIIFSYERKVITYVNKKGERLSYTLNTALQMSKSGMIKRLKYMKDFFNMISDKTKKKKDKEKPE